MTTKRRTVLVELDLPAPRWSGLQLELLLNEQIPDLHPVVYGEIAPSDFIAAWRKLLQLSREIEATPGPWPALVKDQNHSAHKALSFWREVCNDEWWTQKISPAKKS